MIKRVSGMLASRALALLTLAALALLSGGIAIKYDPATAAIVTGVIILADMEIVSLRGRPK